MEKLSNKIADILLGKHYIEESMYNIYQYGMQMILEIGFSFITSVIICCLWGKIIEGIIFYAIFIPLRSYLGGFHMKSYRTCYVCSCITFVIVLGLSAYNFNYFISWLILSIAMIVLFLEAKKEKIKDVEGRHFYPKICTMLLVVIVVGIICTVLGAASKLFLLACTNILVVASKLLERTQAIEEA